MRTIYVNRMINGQPVKWRMDVDDQMTVVTEGPADSFPSPANPSGAEAQKALNNNPRLREQIEAAHQEIRQRQIEMRMQHAAASEPNSAAMDAYKRALDSRGIKYTVNESGQVVILNVPVREKQIVQFFDLSQPVPDVPGMADIRKNYEDELNQMQTSGCSTCQINSLQRKYREVLMNTVFKDNK